MSIELRWGSERLASLALLERRLEDHVKTEVRKDVINLNSGIEEGDKWQSRFTDIWRASVRGGAGGAGIGIVSGKVIAEVFTHLPNWICGMESMQHVDKFFANPQNDIFVAGCTMVVAGVVGGLTSLASQVKYQLRKLRGEKPQATKPSRDIINAGLTGSAIGMFGEQGFQRYITNPIPAYLAHIPLISHMQQFLSTTNNDMLALAYSATIAGIVGLAIGGISALADKWGKEDATKQTTAKHGVAG